MRGSQKLFNTVAVSALVVVCLFSAPTVATAVTTNLNDGETIDLAVLANAGSNTGNATVQIGDKVFGEASWSPSAADTDMALANVKLQAILNPTYIGFQLQFTLPWTAGDFSGDKDIVFQYSVAVTDSSNLISDFHLSLTGTTSGGDAEADVAEYAYSSGPGVGNIGNIQAWVYPGYPELAEAGANLNSFVTNLWIYKDMHLVGDQYEGGDTVSVTAVDQTFSQIPEPSTLLLVGLGLLGAVAVNRKRKS